MSRRFEGKIFEELFTHTKKGCWIWQGHIHTTGSPKYKNQSAKILAFEKYNRPLRHNERIRGTVCKNKSCIRPGHQILEEINVC